jgi:hypothetical protein
VGVPMTCPNPEIIRRIAGETCFTSLMAACHGTANAV